MDPGAESLLIEQVHPALRVEEDALRRLLALVLSEQGYTLEYLGVILADHETILDLNRSYLDHDYHTDVLSFSLSEPEEASVVDGEVYVDLDTAAERHAEFGTSFEEEVQRYVVHGLLHLLGYDDATPEAKQAMHDLEDRYLAALRRAGP